MESIYKDHFINMYYDASKSYLKSVWNENSTFESMSIEEFKKVLLEWRNVVIEHSIKYTLIDSLRFEMPLTSELQDWILDNITIELKRDYDHRKACFVVPLEFIAGLGIEDLAEELQKNERTAETRYFDNVEDAEKWLLND